MFTQSPIEAAIWSSFVATQDWIVQNLLNTPVFKAAVFTWLGFHLIRTIYAMSSFEKPDVALSRFLLTLVISAFGFSFLSISSSSFKPLNANADAWSSSGNGRAVLMGENSLGAHSNGLEVYKLIHSATNQLATFMSGRIAAMFSDSQYNHSPYLFLNTMAMTAVSTLDDPKSLTDLNWLFENCGDNKSAPIIAPNSSYSSLFNLADSKCKQRYQELLSSLKSWSESRWVKSLYDIGDIGTQYVSTKLGFGDQETLKNKIIASAMVNMARSKMGNIYPGSVNSRAMLDSPESSTATSFFVGLGNSLSVGGLGE